MDYAALLGQFHPSPISGTTCVSRILANERPDIVLVDLCERDARNALSECNDFTTLLRTYCRRNQDDIDRVDAYMRAYILGEHVSDAVQYCETHHIPLGYIGVADDVCESRVSLASAKFAGAKSLHDITDTITELNRGIGRTPTKQEQLDTYRRMLKYERKISTELGLAWNWFNAHERRRTKELERAMRRFQGRVCAIVDVADLHDSRFQLTLYSRLQGTCRKRIPLID